MVYRIDALVVIPADPCLNKKLIKITSTNTKVDFD